MTSIELYALWIKCGRPMKHEFVRMNAGRVTRRQWEIANHKVSCSGSMLHEAMQLVERDRKKRLKTIAKRIIELSELPGDYKHIEKKLVEQYRTIQEVHYI